MTVILPRARRSRLGVDVLAALNLVGALTKWITLAFVLPLAVALIHGEAIWYWLVCAGATLAVGGGLELVTRGKETVGPREGFLVVSLTWLVAAAVGALPYLLSGDSQLDRPLDAYFEAMSGFTTTGATILTDVERLPNSILMWRQFTQWLGGMGIIVLALAVLPRLRVGGRQLFESEAPGPEIGGLAASIRATAQRLWILYVGLTAAMVAILVAFGLTGVDRQMGIFESLAHAFTTLPTGGFSTRARGFEEFAPASQWVAIFFMVLAGANFALLYLALARGRLRPLLRDEEIRLYVGVLALGSLLLFLELLAENLYRGEEAVRHAVFQAVSNMTTTGAASADFAEWSGLALVVIVGLMFFGGTAGSTSGSVKIVRHVLIGRILRRELDQTVHPELVSPIRLNGTVVNERAVRAVIVFVLLYVGIFALGTLAIVIDSARADVELTPFVAIAAAATTLGNVGPAVGFAGPMGTFEPFSDASTGVMIALMWLGRLELIPVVVLFTRSYWRV